LLSWELIGVAYCWGFKLSSSDHADGFCNLAIAWCAYRTRATAGMGGSRGLGEHI
jgi:hypothetical protein